MGCGESTDIKMVPLEIGGCTVELYWMDTGVLEDEACFSCAYQALSRGRQKKVDAFLFRKDKRLSLGAGLLLRQGLAAHGINEREAVFAYGENGKPYLPDYPDVQFNLSHSGGMAVAVFADTAVGCDIEQIGTADLPLAAKFFPEGEYRYLARFPEGYQRDAAFYRLWTLKESFVKTTGAGLALPLDAFEIVIAAGGCDGRNEQIEVRQNVDPAARYLFAEPYFRGYCVSVCLRTDCDRYRKKCERCPDAQMDQRVCYDYRATKTCFTTEKEYIFMADCSNNRPCPCTFDCPRHGRCCECVAHHRDNDEGVPGCFFSAEAEATYDRSIEALCRDRGIL